MGNDLNVSGVNTGSRIRYVRECLGFANDNSEINIPIGQRTVQNEVPKGLGIEKSEENKVNQEQQNAQQAEKINVADVQKQIKYEDDAVKLTSARELTGKDAHKKAVEEAKTAYMKNGTSVNRHAVADEKQAEEMAEDYVENKENLEDFYSTRTYLDKAEYKKAEKERKAQRKELAKEYREQGLSRREAKKKAEAQLVENKYLKNKDAREYIENHRSDFYDENGNFSQAKYKKFALDAANTHTQADETVNGHLSLKERREFAQKHDMKARSVYKIADAAGLDCERDNSGLYKTLTIAGTTAAGAGIGSFFSAAAAAADSAATAGAAASGAGAAVASGVPAGAGIGAGVGGVLSNFIKDKGNKEADIYEPGKPRQVSTPTPLPPTTPPSQPVAPVVTPVITQPCPEEKWTSETCDHLVQKGDNWSSVAQAKVLINGKKPDGKLLRAYVHAEKLKHGITNFGLNTMPEVYRKGKNAEKCTLRLYSDFADLLADEALVKKHPELKLLKDAEITFNCDGKVDHRGNVVKPRKAYTRWFGAMTNPVGYKQDCHDPQPVMIK